MPIYEYECQQCGHEFETIAKETDLPNCPRCGSSSTSKLMSCCARRNRADSGNGYAAPASGGCGGCSGGNCASCGR